MTPEQMKFFLTLYRKSVRYIVTTAGPMLLAVKIVRRLSERGRGDSDRMLMTKSQIPMGGLYQVKFFSEKTCLY